MSVARLAKTSQKRRFQRGFTLVELMAVVTITAILGTVGVVLVRQHFRDAKSSEAVTLIQAIRVAEESRRAETGTYQNCSGAGTPWYPGTPNGTMRAWQQPAHTDYAAWRNLGISRPSGTQFGFLVHAGNPGTALPTPVTNQKPTWTTPVDPWYVIQGAGDRDKDGTFSFFLASSFNGELYTENDME
jgi:prepilin-type N-terminal cleavage/methylation domain-containing protein